MDRRILIDTSAWIEFFRGSDSKAAAVVDHLLAQDAAAISEVVMTELLQGAKDVKEYRGLEVLLGALHPCPLPDDVWMRIAASGFKLRCAGFSGVRIADMLIAETAYFNNIPLYTLDKHFKFIAEIIPLKLL